MSNFVHSITTIDGLESIYPCIHKVGDTWNGFMCPYVTKETHQRIVEDFRKLGEETNLSYEEIIEDYLDPSNTIEFEGVEYIDVGVGLCWSHVEDWELDDKGNKILLFGSEVQNV